MLFRSISSFTQPKTPMTAVPDVLWLDPLAKLDSMTQLRLRDAGMNVQPATTLEELRSGFNRCRLIVLRLRDDTALLREVRGEVGPVGDADGRTPTEGAENAAQGGQVPEVAGDEDRRRVPAPVTGCVVARSVRVVVDPGPDLFGGEGVFFARLTGPGRVWLQSLPLSRLADRIVAASPRADGSSSEQGSLLGGLGNLIDGKD